MSDNPESAEFQEAENAAWLNEDFPDPDQHYAEEEKDFWRNHDNALADREDQESFGACSDLDREEYEASARDEDDQDHS